MADPQLISIEQQCDGWVKKYLLTYRMADGTLHPYEVASRKNLEEFRAGLQARSAQAAAPDKRDPSDAVCIAALTPRRTVVMIREFRYPLNSWCIALPAGLVDAGETLEECAARELHEETGYRLVSGTDVKLLPQTGFSSAGMTDEAVQVVFMEAEKAGEPHTEANELIEVFELPLDDIPRFLAQNTLPIGTRAQLILEILRHRAL